MLRYSDDAKAFLKRKEKRYGQCRAMTMLARKIARAVYQMLKHKGPFDALQVPEPCGAVLAVLAAAYAAGIPAGRPQS
jgi:hypothetical protein